MSKIELISGSCADQVVDAVVNAANCDLWEGSGICGVIFRKAGSRELTEACRKHKTPLNDGDAVITPAFGMKNAKAIIHAVGPNFAVTPTAFDELFKAYYNSLVVLKDNGYHSISFPLISSGIFGGNLHDPVGESTRQCLRAYGKFTEAYPDADVDVKLCAFTFAEKARAEEIFEQDKWKYMFPESESVDKAFNEMLNNLQSIMINIGGFFGGHELGMVVVDGDKVVSSQADYRFELQKEAGVSQNQKVVPVKMKKEEFIQRLKELHVGEWANSYCKPYVLDGTQWELEIKFNDGLKRRITGSNEYPKNFPELLKLLGIERCFDEEDDL